MPARPVRPVRPLQPVRPVQPVLRLTPGVSRPRGSSHLRVLGARAPAALKAASKGPALLRHASIDALLAAPPFPCLRPPMTRICEDVGGVTLREDYWPFTPAGRIGPPSRGSGSKALRLR